MTCSFTDSVAVAIAAGGQGRKFVAIMDMDPRIPESAGVVERFLRLQYELF